MHIEEMNSCCSALELSNADMDIDGYEAEWDDDRGEEVLFEDTPEYWQTWDSQFLSTLLRTWSGYDFVPTIVHANITVTPFGKALRRHLLDTGWTEVFKGSRRQGHGLSTDGLALYVYDALDMKDTWRDMAKNLGITPRATQYNYSVW